jgi:hypothetical protein
MARHAATRILEQHPEIARDNIYTAVVCGELEDRWNKWSCTNARAHACFPRTYE